MLTVQAAVRLCIYPGNSQCCFMMAIHFFVTSLLTFNNDVGVFSNNALIYAHVCTGVNQPSERFGIHTHKQGE